MRITNYSSCNASVGDTLMALRAGTARPTNIIKAISTKLTKAHSCRRFESGAKGAVFTSCIITTSMMRKLEHTQRPISKSLVFTLPMPSLEISAFPAVPLSVTFPTPFMSADR